MEQNAPKRAEPVQALFGFLSDTILLEGHPTLMTTQLLLLCEEMSAVQPSETVETSRDKIEQTASRAHLLVALLLLQQVLLLDPQLHPVRRLRVHVVLLLLQLRRPLPHRQQLALCVYQLLVVLLAVHFFLLPVVFRLLRRERNGTK